ncbi:DNA replication and repair protein RecF [bacterium BMS3Abin05]|nr:DNA replication and repair protein RecF [bacterium BMS3Abin05]GBE28475.1 DNA replication and repair protein RecF [bacterium BMS3Bbin03]HDL78654.1 DNA replication and repair protein RecF [Bacteroidota bacterium]HDZ11302.1 DNA replication and repair protein RecF [Bacteroidota bacterium]
MILKSIYLQQFRNYLKHDFTFEDGVNVIYGYNGQGKTNLLEAISYTCITKSFRTNTDAEAIPFHTNFFKITSHFIFDPSIKKDVTVEYIQGEGKRIYIDGVRVQSASEVVGLFPIIILTPENEAITYGSPSERRRFLDFILSQTDKFYLTRIQDFRRVVRQRNKILFDAQNNRYGFREKIEPWNLELYELNKVITNKRIQFIRDFQEIFRPIFKQLTLDQEDISISYVPSFKQEFQEKEVFLHELEKILNLEILRGNTFIGPHRDEISFLNNEWDLRKYGSRGQHRTAVIALKIAEYFYVYQIKKEKPIFLLDDVYTEIDKIREKNLTEFFEDLGQIFLTTSDVDLKIDSGLEKHKKISYYFVDTTQPIPHTELGQTE